MSSSSDRKTRSQKSREGHDRYRPAEQKYEAELSFGNVCHTLLIDLHHAAERRNYCTKTLALGFVDCFAKQNTTYIKLFRKAVDRIVMKLPPVRSDSQASICSSFTESNLEIERNIHVKGPT